MGAIMFRMINSKEIITKKEIESKYGCYNVVYESALDNVEVGSVVAISDDKDMRKLSSLHQKLLKDGKIAILFIWLNLH